MPETSVAHAKSHFSELVAKSAINNERFIITRRNKPVAALVSIDDLRRIEQLDERQGLAAVASSWSGFDEIADALEDLSGLRERGGGVRNVSL